MNLKFFITYCVPLSLMRFYFLVILFFGQFTATGQTGGMSTFSLLDLTYNARSAGLSGDFIAVKDQDLNLGIANPSLLNETMGKSLTVSQALLASGINYGQVGYGFSLLKGLMSTSLRYVSYGEFKRTDVGGTQLGTFHPFECIIGAGYGQQLNPRISVGANANFIYSQLETYNAFGFAIDLAGTYTSKSNNFLITALVKNAGFQFNNYYKKEKDPLPVEFQLATSIKLKHAPFRFTVLAHHLNKWDLTYIDPNVKPTVDALTGDTIPVKQAGFVEKLARHLTYQAEILISKNIHLRLGFDYQRRQEMKIEARPGLAGFSCGLGLYFKKISIDYGFMIFSNAGFNNLLTLSTNLGKWKK